MSSSDAMRRIGRGGAGNFISAKDTDDATKAQAEDLEAQKSSAPAAPAPAPASSSQYVRGGRGGAGNFSEPPTIAESIDREDVVDRTKAAVMAALAKPRAGLSGRGGMGNWSSADDQAAKDEAEKEKQHEIESKITQDVEAGLPMPPKTYHQHDRDVVE